MFAPEIDGVANPLGPKGDRVLHGADLSGNWIALYQGALSVDFHYERNLPIVEPLGHTLLEDDPAEASFDSQLHHKRRVDVLVVEVSRRPMLQPLVIGKEHALPVVQEDVHLLRFHD